MTRRALTLRADAAPVIEYETQWLTTSGAAQRLSMSTVGLVARIRRTEPDREGRRYLGAGVYAIRFGARSWRVRFPIDPDDDDSNETDY